MLESMVAPLFVAYPEMLAPVSVQWMSDLKRHGAAEQVSVQLVLDQNAMEPVPLRLTSILEWIEVLEARMA